MAPLRVCCLFLPSFFLLPKAKKGTRGEGIRYSTTIDLFFVLLLFSEPFLPSIRKTKITDFCSFLGVFLLLSVPSRRMSLLKRKCTNEQGSRFVLSEQNCWKSGGWIAEDKLEGTGELSQRGHFCNEQLPAQACTRGSRDPFATNSYLLSFLVLSLRFLAFYFYFFLSRGLWGRPPHARAQPQIRQRETVCNSLLHKKSKEQRKMEKRGGRGRR